MFGDLRMLAYFKLARAGKILLERQRFDFIVSTYQPEVVHFAAHKLARDFGVPWVADYRDMWFKDISGLAFGITSYLVGKIEKHLLKQACLVSTVSEGLSRQLQAHFGREVHVCYNGYVRINEHDRHTSHPGIKRIVYTGRVYRKLRDPSLLFGVLGQLKNNVPNLGRLLTVDFYGHMEQWVDDLIKKHDIEDCVRLHGAVSYQESLSAQDGADFLLFLDWMDRATEGVLTGKLFEYLGTGRPILSIGPGQDTEAAKIIEQCMAGLVMSAENDILQFLESWLIRGEMTAPVPDKIEIARYSRENQARALLEQIQRKLPS
jgi:glycosyltransferase involved in cell wall biosynthesis